MAGRPRKHRLEAGAGEREALERIRNNPDMHPRKRLGAAILLLALDGYTTGKIAEKAGMSQAFVAGLIRQAPLLGLLETVEAMPLCRHPVKITDAAATWVCELAQKSPSGPGPESHAAWSMESLAGYIRSHCEEAGYPELRKIVKSTVWHLLRQGRDSTSGQDMGQNSV